MTEKKDIQFIDLSPSKEIVTVPFKRLTKKEREKVISPPTKLTAKKPRKSSRKTTEKDLDSKEKKVIRENAELIVTEKPQAAMKIAYALSDSTPIAKRSGKVSYYECTKNGKKIYVGCAVGHLYGLIQKEKGWPIFALEWNPGWEKKGAAYMKPYADVLRQLSKKASSFTMACDYDIEGEVIGLNVMRFLCGQSDASRMKFSALTKEDIVAAYENKTNHIDWGMAYAGETRHYLDWLYGINLSRGLMNAIKKAGSFSIMSIGRVQGPALSLIVKKERSIQQFKSRPYWQVSLLASQQGKNARKAKLSGAPETSVSERSIDLIVRYSKDIFEKKDIEAFKKLEGKNGEAKTEDKQDNLPPPAPFDLTTLQLEAYKFYGITPAQILQITQQLYLAGLISYPRTSSQKLPLTIGYEKVLKKLPKELTKHVSRKIPIEGKKSDPAHPSIYPTGETESLSGENEKVYDLILRRFISCFCSDAVLETRSVKVTVDEKVFSARGLKIKEKGWLAVYNAKMEEKTIPELNGTVIIKEVNIEEKVTNPPHRYSAASLVSELAKRNLGTKSTRAMIVETLYKRNYIEDKQIKATPIGISVADSLEKYSPLILDEDLTRKFEKEMDSIQTSKRSETKAVSGAPDIENLRAHAKEEQQKILDTAKTVLTEIAVQFKKNEENIGKALLESLKEKRALDREAAKVMLCPKCQKGWIAIKRNRQGRQFLACDAYPECKTTYSLPPYGMIKHTDKKCEKCSWPILMTLRKGKRPWLFCFNPECRKEQAAARESSENEEAAAEPTENTSDNE